MTSRWKTTESLRTLKDFFPRQFPELNIYQAHRKIRNAISVITALSVYACGGGGTGPGDQDVTINPAALQLRIDEEQTVTANYTGLITDPGNRVRTLDIFLQDGQDLVTLDYDGNTVSVTGKRDQVGTFTVGVKTKDGDGAVLASADIPYSINPKTDFLEEIVPVEFGSRMPIDATVQIFGGNGETIAETGTPITLVDGQVNRNFNTYRIQAKQNGVTENEAGTRQYFFTLDNLGDDAELPTYEISVMTKELLESQGITLPELRQYFDEVGPLGTMYRTPPGTRYWIKSNLQPIEGIDDSDMTPAIQQEFQNIIQQYSAGWNGGVQIEAVIEDASNIGDAPYEPSDIYASGIAVEDGTILIVANQGMTYQDDGSRRLAGAYPVYDGFRGCSTGGVLEFDVAFLTNLGRLIDYFLHEKEHLYHPGHSTLPRSLSNLSGQVPVNTPSSIIDGIIRQDPSVPLCEKYANILGITPTEASQVILDAVDNAIVNEPYTGPPMANPQRIPEHDLIRAGDVFVH